MPKGMGYKTGPGYPRAGRAPGVGGRNNDSYQHSPAKPPAGANRHGFAKNPKQRSSGRMTSDPFPRPRDAVGPSPWSGKQGRQT